MKKFLMIMGAIFCGLILLFLIGLIFVAIRGTRLDQESRTYADSAIAAIVTHWDEDAFFQMASPEMKRVVSPTQGDQLFHALSRLGHLQHSDPVKGQATVHAVLGQSSDPTAHYEAAAKFDKGDATIVLDLIKHEAGWQVLGLHINSPVFLSN